MDDLPAIRRLKRGDIGGLECLIARYQEKALRVAFLITHDEPMAEDVVQEVFIHFYQRTQYFDEARPFEPYFLRSVVNAAINCIGREKKGQYFPERSIRNWRTSSKREPPSKSKWSSTPSSGKSGMRWKNYRPVKGQ